MHRWSPGPAPSWGDTGNGSSLGEGESGFTENMAAGGFLQWMAPRHAFMVAPITLSELSHKKDMELGGSVLGNIDEEKMGEVNMIKFYSI